MSSAEGAFDGVWWLGACCEIGFSSFLLVLVLLLVLEVGHSMIPSSRTRKFVWIETLDQTSQDGYDSGK
jgi:hypothetical protein